MGDSSDSEEFYDAEETPNKSAKKQSTQKTHSAKTEIHVKNNSTKEPIDSALQQNIGEDESKFSKNVVAERRRFRELRKVMQTDEDDAAPSTNSTPESQTSSMEGVYAAPPKSTHPFRIIEHDAMSLQSMTSLGRIGRILSGTLEPAGRESAAQGTSGSREPLAPTDETAETSPEAPVLTMQEPDVIASTKANSLKYSRGPEMGRAIVTMSGQMSASLHTISRPVAPPRRKKKSNVSGSQSLCTPERDTVSLLEEGERRGSQDTLCSVGHRIDGSHMTDLYVEADCPPAVPLPSPTSAIESLTRELRHSLSVNPHPPASAPVPNTQVSRIRTTETSLTDRKLSLEKLERSGSSSRSSTGTSIKSNTTARSHYTSLDIRSAIKGEYVVRAADEERLRAAGVLEGAAGGTARAVVVPGGARTQSEERRNHPILSHSSLGSVTRGDVAVTGVCITSVGTGRERRRSAGDEGAGTGGARRGGAGGSLGLPLRTRTDSGQPLSDMQILEQVTVLNLDTGERVPLSVAEHKLPQCINPLSLHIMRLTSEYIEGHDQNADDNTRDTDEESEAGSTMTRSSGADLGGGRRVTDVTSVEAGSDEQTRGGLRKKTERLKRLIGSTMKRTMVAARSLAAEVSHARHREDVADVCDEVRGEHNIKLRASNSHKGPYDLEGCVSHVQEMWCGGDKPSESGAVWCMKFSVCGRLLATAGQDKCLRIWVLRDALHFFEDMRTKYAAQKSSPTPSQESLAPPLEEQPQLGPMAPFCAKPFWTYEGHTSDLLDVAWSKTYFVLSSSMDKTVRLWHISRRECLCCFQHIDFVTAIAFHPRDDRYFLSGSLDGKLRLWNIPDKKVAVWNEVDGQTKLITAANFCQNGKFAVVGTYDGRCIFYTTDQLKYHTQIDVRSTRGKNSTGRKISGIEPMPHEDKILVTSNDSRIRLYDLRDLNLSCKYKGYVNVSSQIKASFSHDGKYIVSGSENQCIYIWKTHHDYSKFSSVRRDRNDFWEGIKAHNAVVTCAVYAPNPDHILRTIAEREIEAARNAEKENADRNSDKDVDAGGQSINAGGQSMGGRSVMSGGVVGAGGHVLVSADFNGCIKVFLNKSKPKHSSLPASALA